MKKIINYFTYLVVLFFMVFISSVKAGHPHDLNFVITPTVSAELDFEEFIGINCDTSGFEYLKGNLTVTKNPTTGEQESASMSVTYNKSYYPESFPEPTVEKITCTYDRHKNKGYTDVEFDVTFSIKPIHTNIMELYLISGSKESFNLFSRLYENGLYMIEGLKSVIEITDGSDAGEANEYIDIECPTRTTSSCVLKINNKYTSEKGEVVAYYDIKFTDVTGHEYTDSFIVKILPGREVYADFAPYATCSFGSEWSNTKYSTRMEAALKVGSKINLPNCTADENKSLYNPLYTFAGWVDLGEKLEGSDDKQLIDIGDSQVMDLCKEYTMDKKDTPPVMTDESIGYYACFVSNTGIALNPNGGVMSKTGDKEIDGVHFFITEGNFNLPRITKIPDRYDLYSEKTFHGWRNNTTGAICNPNETTCTVPADGSYYTALYSNNNLSANDAQTVTVYVNEQTSIFLSGSVTSCSTSSSKITATLSGGECFINGVSESRSYEDVTVIANGRTYIYKVKVLERYGNFTNWMDDVVLDLSKNADYGTDASAKSVTTPEGISLCEEYVVVKGNVPPTYFASFDTGNGDFSLYINQYRATSKCDSRLVHLALCMDPGRPGPETNGATIYVVDETFDPTNPFGKVLTNIVKNFVTDGVDKSDLTSASTKKIAAANVAARLAEYFSAEELANAEDNKTTTWYKNAIAAYTAAGNALRDKCGYVEGDIDDKLVGCSDNNIRTALTTAWTWSDTEVLTYVVQYLSSYENTETIAKINDAKNNIATNNTEYNTDTISFVFEGKIEGFGADVDLTTLSIKSDCKELCNDTCCVLKIPSEAELRGKTEIPYTFTVTLDESAASKISSLSPGEKPAITVSTTENGYKAANVFMLKPRNGNHQRMATFNLEGAMMRFPFDFNTQCDLNYAPLNPSSDQFNASLFRTMGCCDKINGDAAYEETYKFYCEQNCFTSTFQVYCNPKPEKQVGTGSSADGRVDSYSIKEGRIGANGAYALYCVVDVSENDIATGTYTGNKETRKKVDYSGNKYANNAIVNNDYCVISCREEWDISLPGFDNFIGSNAVNAGGYFSINNYMFFNTKRSCYSTFIDYESYVDEQQKLSEEAVNAWTKHSEFTQVYSILEDSKSTMVAGNYYSWTWDDWHYCHTRHCTGGYEEECTGEGEDKKCKDVCQGWEDCWHKCYEWYTVYEGSCTVYTIDTEDSKYFTSYYYKKLSDYAGDFQNILQAEIKYTTPTPKTSTNRLGGSGEISGGGSMIYSKYRATGTTPDEEEPTYSPENSDGKCCGDAQFNCNTLADHEYLLDVATYKGENVKDTIVSTVRTVSNNMSTIDTNSQKMSKCQNFYLQNNSTKNTWNAVDTSIKAYGNTPLFDGSDIIPDPGDDAKRTEIQSNFEPEASYSYSEQLFMAELAKESNSNVIIPFTSENGSVSVGSCGKSTGRKNAYGEELEVCLGVTKLRAYNVQRRTSADLIWTPENEGVEYKDDDTAEITDLTNALVQYKLPLCKTLDENQFRYDDSNSTKCEVSSAAVYEVNYLTRSLQNSSYYVNKGRWYLDSATDIKGHGDTAQAAVANNGAGMNAETTGEYADDYNSFPIGLDTPRNIYQYSYAFRGIGIFPNNSTCIGGDSACGNSNPPGRIMGNPENSMIKTNERICFYEVFEDLCTCCGDPIITYTHSTSKINDTDKYLNDNGYPFEPSNDNYTTKTSNFGPKTSTVSLFDIDGTNNRTLGDNWTSTDPYYFIGELRYTKKGYELMNHIMAKGDTIYNNEGNLIPEYSYTLTPSLLAQIRGDNVQYGYSPDTITINGKVCFETGPCNENSEDHGFYHFGSKFLEEFLSSAQTPGFTSIISGGTGTSCIVTNANPAAPFNRNCRWVDYKNPSGDYLAFK